MRAVHVHGGVLEVRWTWLPFWLAVHPHLMGVVNREMRDRVLLGGVSTSDSDLDALHDFVVERIVQLFPAFDGLDAHLHALKGIEGRPDQ